jgi:hypothetical protein
MQHIYESIFFGGIFSKVKKYPQDKKKGRRPEAYYCRKKKRPEGHYTIGLN